MSEGRNRMARRARTGAALGLVSLVASLLAGCGPGPARIVGAGDIASCDQSNDTRTAQLLDDIGDQVVALGDSAYENGTLAEYRNCYGPNWGRHNGRVRPVPGNHEADSGFNGYFDYYGSRAGPARRGYDFYDVGSWRAFASTPSGTRRRRPTTCGPTTGARPASPPRGTRPS